jgi:hypothetical protein
VFEQAVRKRPVCPGQKPSRTIAVSGPRVDVLQEGSGSASVRVVRDGTEIDVLGFRPAERLAQAAASLRPVR